MQPVKINSFRKIGPGQPTFIAAEIGINHNGDLDLAFALIDAAADAGVDAVKFQNYVTEDFVTDRSLTLTYRRDSDVVVESQYDLFKRCELASDWLPALARYCEEREVIFFSTPTSAAGMRDAIAAGASLIKNGSDFLTNTPLIEAMAEAVMPTVISTGMSTVDEIDDAVAAYRRAGGQNLILLHCTSSYPTPPHEVHLRKIVSLRDRYECPVGLSDHTEGSLAAIGSVALGACLLEKHFTLDKAMDGPDHWFSADPEEMKSLVKSVRSMEQILGSLEIGYTESERLGRNDFRLSCAAAIDMRVGRSLSADDITFRRPGTGIPPSMRHSLVGRVLLRSVSVGHVFSAEDFE